MMLLLSICAIFWSGYGINVYGGSLPILDFLKSSGRGI